VEHVIAGAAPADLDPVRRLLGAAALPHGDIVAAMLEHFLVARRGAELIGVIGLEPLGEVGLLRSAAVAAPHRGVGLGVALARAIEQHARAVGVRRLYLLTTTAEGFFDRLGYRTVPRPEAPAAIRDTTEYRELCASTSVCMVKTVDDSRRGGEAMSGTSIERPAADEYAPYFAKYVERIGDGDILEILRRQAGETAALLAALSERDADYRYAEGKWSIKEVVGHVADTERVMVYRAVCFARGEQAPLPGFDENAYVRRARFGSRRLAELVAEFQAVRAATIPFFAGLDAEELRRRGTANDRPYTVRAVAFIVAGHERHHRTILEERYLRGLGR
jgi:N-acetylglutamate synthase-like GNAT family acetyltransferase/uncharacterized damage-inducible protein DinB